MRNISVFLTSRATCFDFYGKIVADIYICFCKLIIVFFKHKALLGCHGCSEQFIEVFKNKRDIISYFFYLVCSEKAICGYSQEAFNPFRYF